MRIAVTGAGVVSAIGEGKDKTLASLLHPLSGVGPLKHLSTVHTDLPCGEVDIPSTEIPRTSLLGRMALGEALAETGVSDVSDVTFINGTTVGVMDKAEVDYPSFKGTAYDCKSSTDAIAAGFGSFSSVTTISTACSSALNAIILACRLIRSGRASKVIAGGAESLTRYHLNGFNSLMILSKEICRPFDAGRDGLNLGEGAGYLFLESEESALGRGAKILGYVDGWGNACDAYHQTASSPDGQGAYLAMKEALEVSGFEPSQIDYINAHGTGTPDNDAAESTAIRRIFGENHPPVSSTKPFTGHTTSASGGIEAVFCLLALFRQFLPVNLGWENADPACIVPVTDPTPERPLKHVMCNAFGFGGNDSSIILSKADE